MIGKIWMIVNILRNDQHPIRRIIGAMLLRMPFDIAKITRAKIRIHDFCIGFHSSSLSIAFWCNPQDRTLDYKFIKGYLKKNDIYIDVGANIGTMLIPAAKVVIEGKAIGVEPHPRIFSYLRDNVKLNDIMNNVELYNCALGNARGNVTFSNKRYDDVNRIEIKREGLIVPMMLLDDIGEQYDKINLLKIDVEGYEKYVCEGGRETLGKTDCVYFEICKEQYEAFGYSVTDMLTLLEKMDFKLFLVNPLEGHTMISIDKGCELPRNRTRNMLAVRNIGDFIARTGWRIDSSTKEIT